MRVAFFQVTLFATEPDKLDRRFMSLGLDLVVADAISVLTGAPKFLPPVQFQHGSLPLACLNFD